MRISPATAPDELIAFAVPPVEDSPLLERIGFLLAKSHVRLRERADSQLEPLGLDVKQYGSLTVLQEKGALSQQSLAEMVGCDRTTMVAIVDRLERSGFVERQRNPRDRRAYALRITSAGRRAHSKANEIVLGLEAEFLAPLSDAERDSLVEMLRRLLLA